MPTPGSVWVMTHGHAVQSETVGWWEGLEKVDGRGYTDIVGARGGAGAVFTGKERTAHWFHFSIPTPAHVSEPDNPSVTYRAHLTDVGVQFQTNNHEAFVDNVHVWERDNHIYASDWYTTPRDRPLRLDGDFRGVWQQGGEGSNVFGVPGRPPVWGALGVCVKVHFERQSNIWFTQVGARVAYQREN